MPCRHGTSTRFDYCMAKVCRCVGVTRPVLGMSADCRRKPATTSRLGTAPTRTVLLMSIRDCRKQPSSRRIGNSLRRIPMQVRNMLNSHPAVHGTVDDALIQCIEECYACAQTCVSCADACLGEPMVKELAQCIRLNLDCSDICVATGAVASRRTGSNGQTAAAVINACITACALCAEECEKHASKHEHCKTCATACRRCERACRRAEGPIASPLSH